MILKARKSFRSWMLLYIAFAAVILLSNQNGEAKYGDLEVLSPVTVGAEAPALAVDALVRRSDI